ncbi:MAG: GNAT family N-acetyltransferase [Clostridia bacterium]|nr:GNAT family N-acetyltransferase [Clostridia bacterium]
MTVRPFVKHDMIDRDRIMSVAFVCSKDIESRRKGIDQCESAGEKGFWGYFDDDGKIGACTKNYEFMSYYAGQPVKSGGIGDVCTLPEYRNQGAIRHLLDAILNDAYANGEVFSTLYPFNHSFYRKFGYEIFFDLHRYILPPEQLSKIRSDWKIRRLEYGEEIPLLTKLHNDFGKRYNACIYRTDAHTREENRGDTYSDLASHYLLTKGDEMAYLSYVGTEDDDGPNAAFEIRDYAFASPEGLRAILSLLGKLTAEHRKINIRLPEDVPLMSMVSEQYEVKHEAEATMMMRITNVEAALKLLPRPADCRFTVAVSDDFLPQNAATYCVTGDTVTRTDEAPDLIIDIRALSQLWIGYLSLDEAKYRPDVQICANEELLRSIFVRRPIFTTIGF